MAMSDAPRDVPKAHPIPPPGPMGCWRDKGLGCPLLHHITALGQSPQPLKGYAGCRAQPGAVLGLREARPGSEMINHLGSGWLTPGSREKPGLRAPGAAEGAGQGPPIRPPSLPNPPMCNSLPACGSHLLLGACCHRPNSWSRGFHNEESCNIFLTLTLISGPGRLREELAPRPEPPTPPCLRSPSPAFTTARSERPRGVLRPRNQGEKQNISPLPTPRGARLRFARPQKEVGAGSRQGSPPALGWEQKVLGLRPGCSIHPHPNAGRFPEIHPRGLRAGLAPCPGIPNHEVWEPRGVTSSLGTSNLSFRRHWKSAPRPHSCPQPQ